jgi:hypothetical protein
LRLRTFSFSAPLPLPTSLPPRLSFVRAMSASAQFKPDLARLAVLKVDSIHQPIRVRPRGTHAKPTPFCAKHYDFLMLFIAAQ